MAYVQSARTTNQAASATTVALAVSSNVTAGSVLAVCVAWDLVSGANITATLASSQSGTPSAALNQIESTGQDPNRRCCAFYIPNAGAGATTLTATFSATTTNRNMAIVEFSGRHVTTPLSANAGQFVAVPGTVANAVTSGTDTPDTANSDLVGFTIGSISGSDDVAVGTGWTSRLGFGFAEQYQVETQSQTTAASVAATFTLVGGGNLMLTHLLGFGPAGVSAFSLPCVGDSYAVTGTDAGVQQSSPLTWLRVGR